MGIDRIAGDAGSTAFTRSPPWSAASGTAGGGVDLKPPNVACALGVGRWQGVAPHSHTEPAGPLRPHAPASVPQLPHSVRHATEQHESPAANE
ncbi:MAG: hypothetical protein RL721_2207, partial [Candidatus Eisenbacteria bacterium]